MPPNNCQVAEEGVRIAHGRLAAWVQGAGRRARVSCQPTMPSHRLPPPLHGCCWETFLLIVV